MPIDGFDLDEAWFPLIKVYQEPWESVSKVYKHSVHIPTKLNQKQHFIVPRISGIENNVAVFARVIRDKLHDDIEPLKKYIKNTLGAMKNNAGILLESEKEISFQDFLSSSF